MGHLELTPQSVHQLGGFRVQGRSEEAAEVILAGQVTSSLEIPTIGIGAGAACDGQVLVFHDFLGLATGMVPKFVKRNGEVGEQIANAARTFAKEVAERDLSGAGAHLWLSSILQSASRPVEIGHVTGQSFVCRLWRDELPRRAVV